MCAFSVVLITPAHSPEQPTVVCSLPLQGGCGGPASITSTTPRPSAQSPTSQPPVAFVAHCHLRVVGDRAGPAVGGHVPGDTSRPVAVADLGQGEELDAGAEGVASRAAEQAAAVAVAQRDHFPPSGACAGAGLPGSAPIRHASAGLSGYARSVGRSGGVSVIRSARTSSAVSCTLAVMSAIDRIHSSQ